MTTSINVVVPSYIEIDRSIYQARRMRSEYLAKSIKVGITHLLSALARKKSLSTATA